MTSTSQNPSYRIFVLSVLILFFELFFVRWISTEVRLFAYLQNIVIVVCFIGFGIGCFTSKREVRLSSALFSTLILIALFAIPFTADVLRRLANGLGTFEDYLIWYHAVSSDVKQFTIAILLGIISSTLLFLLLIDSFVPLGRLLGRYIDGATNTLSAYSVNLLGSLVGIWLLIAMSALVLPPWTWVAVIVLLFLAVLYIENALSLRNILLLTLIFGGSLFLGKNPSAIEVVWSPYQKLTLLRSRFEHSTVDNYPITVNDVYYQQMIDLSAKRLQMEPQIFLPEFRGLSQYDVPLLLHPKPTRVLLVGAGSGNDAAGALRNGAQEVTAVEIDPEIIRLGREFHPEQPYSSPRVRVVNDDARAFFNRSKEQFEVIVFGLLDSHTVGSMTNARLDHFVYTRESIESAKRLLAPNGIMVLSFEAQKVYIADRIAEVLLQVFGERPLVYRIPGTSAGWGGVTFIAGNISGAKTQIDSNPDLKAFLNWTLENYPLPLTYTTPTTSDDWPYIYLESRRIPILFVLLVPIIWLLLIISSSRFGFSFKFREWDNSSWQFFFMGAAFLLLETQSISASAVAFGSTWWVNAVVISGILTMALLANFIHAKFPKFIGTPVWVLLLLSCIALYFINLAHFAGLPFGAKTLVVGGLTSIPILFSGIAFASTFVRTPRKDVAFAANLLGAGVGGLLQCITFVTGLKALLLVVGGLYAAAWYFERRENASASA